MSLFQHVPIPNKNLALADDDFNKRFWFVTALAFVMKSWQGDKPTMLAGDLSNLSQNDAMELEKVVAKYYCQQFFNYFGCAAQVPHCLFMINAGKFQLLWLVFFFFFLNYKYEYLVYNSN